MEVEARQKRGKGEETNPEAQKTEGDMKSNYFAHQL